MKVLFYYIDIPGTLLISSCIFVSFEMFTLLSLISKKFGCWSVRFSIRLSDCSSLPVCKPGVFRALDHKLLVLSKAKQYGCWYLFGFFVLYKIMIIRNKIISSKNSASVYDLVKTYTHTASAIWHRVMFWLARLTGVVGQRILNSYVFLVRTHPKNRTICFLCECVFFCIPKYVFTDRLQFYVQI